MSLLDQLTIYENWTDYLQYKTDRHAYPGFLRALRDFIDSREYLAVCAKIRSGEAFPLPKRTVINKIHSQKKRVVYTYPYRENMVLKLLTHLLLRKYDNVFSSNLYSFRPAHGAKEAVCLLRGAQKNRNLYSYKADISNYFNTVDIPTLLPMLKDVLADDPALYAFLCRLLTETKVLENGKEIEEEKGIMAGTPQACFYANLYLSAMDVEFAERGILYARYSDDIILFAESEQKRAENVRILQDYLSARRLKINPEKEVFTDPETKWTFLGLSCQNGTVDIAPVSVVKLKHKMRRKTRALHRWQKRKGLSGEKAAKAFIRVFNRKLFDNPSDHELTWARWYFPVITSTESLEIIDHYAQDCIRFLISGKHTKARFNVRYADMKKLGYRSLVHEYYLEKDYGNGNRSSETVNSDR